MCVEKETKQANKLFLKEPKKKILIQMQKEKNTQSKKLKNYYR